MYGAQAALGLDAGGTNSNAICHSDPASLPLGYGINNGPNSGGGPIYVAPKMQAQALCDNFSFMEFNDFG